MFFSLIRDFFFFRKNYEQISRDLSKERVLHFDKKSGRNLLIEIFAEIEMLPGLFPRLFTWNSKERSISQSPSGSSDEISVNDLQTKCGMKTLWVDLAKFVLKQ